MKRYRIVYQSMTAFYDMGYVYANNKEAAEQEARHKATAVNQNEKCLIKAAEVKTG